MAKKKNQTKTSLRQLLLLLLVAVAFGVVMYYARQAMNFKHAETQLESFRASPFLKAKPLLRPKAVSSEITPGEVKTAYHLPSTNTGTGTIAIVDAYDHPRIEKDLAVFNKEFKLRGCTTANGCFEKHMMAPKLAVNKDWAIEAALDVEWAHAIAPTAKILLVEAKSNSGTSLLRAIDYARSRADVVAISLSWGGDEFAGELAFDNNFNVGDNIGIFAASGDSGHGVTWPAVSPKIVAVGGTTLKVSGSTFRSETAWSGSGGGQSTYEPSPDYQDSFGIEGASGKRAVPDVSYNANPATGFPVYSSVAYNGSAGWFMVGGTSAGAPQWAAIHARTGTVTHEKLYADAKSDQASGFFRDITRGSNGDCGDLCNAQSGYDYVTGLGSPLTTQF